MQTLCASRSRLTSELLFSRSLRASLRIRPNSARSGVPITTAIRLLRCAGAHKSCGAMRQARARCAARRRWRAARTRRSSGRRAPGPLSTATARCGAARCTSRTSTGPGCSKALSARSGGASSCGAAQGGSALRCSRRCACDARGRAHAPAPLAVPQRRRATRRHVCGPPHPAPGPRPRPSTRPTPQMRVLRPAGRDARLPHLPLPAQLPPPMRARRRLRPKRPNL